MVRSLSRRQLLGTGGVALAAASGCLRFVGGGGGQATSTPEPTLTAAFTYEPQQPSAGEEVTFDASPSRAPGGEIDRYEWVLIPAPGGATRPLPGDETMTHRFPAGGPVIVGLRVVTAAGERAGTVELVSVSGSAADVGDRLTFEWGEAFVPARDGGKHPEDERSLSFACRRLELRDGEETVAAFAVGGDEEPLYDRGVYGPETTPDGETFRWLGGPKRMTRLVFPEAAVADATALVLDGNLPPIEEPQPVTVAVNGTVATETTLTEQRGRYRFPLA